MKLLIPIDKFYKLKSKELVPIECNCCGETFYRRQARIKSDIKHNISTAFCNMTCMGEYNRRRKVYKCKNCDVGVIRTPSEVKKIKNIFCNHTCAATYNNKHKKRNLWSEEQRNKVKEQNRRNGKKDIYDCICKICNITFKHKNKRKVTCSSKCYKKQVQHSGHLGGRVSASRLDNIRNRSKNERLFFELINEQFDDALPNQRIFNGFDADVTIPSLKLAIHWNGIWHYKQVFNGGYGKYQFEQVQERDRQRILEIENCGYLNYIIKDMGGFNPEFVREEFDKLNKYINALVGNSAFKSDSTPYKEAALSHELIPN